MPIEREGGTVQPEHELPPSSRVARFSGEEPAGAVYGAVQALLWRTEEPAELSAYRFQLNTVSHVAVVGEPPPRALDRQLARLLGKGEPAQMPEAVLQRLHQRGVQERAKADWSEGP